MESDETFMIRIRLADWNKMRKIFPSYKNETAASYFFRLRSHMEEEWKKKYH